MHCSNIQLFCIGRCIIIIITFFILVYIFFPCFYTLDKDINITIIIELKKHDLKILKLKHGFSYIKKPVVPVFIRTLTCSFLLYKYLHLNLSVYRFILLYQSLHLIKFIRMLLHKIYTTNIVTNSIESILTSITLTNSKNS